MRHSAASAGCIMAGMSASSTRTTQGEPTRATAVSTSSKDSCAGPSTATPGLLNRGEGFGNGRTARQVFQRLTKRHALRTASLPGPAPTDLETLLPQDLPEPGTL